MNEELNKKLAEWAGFTMRLVWSDPADIVSRHQFEVWDSPVSKGGSDEIVVTTQKTARWLPNFIQSLDACFKWLVPKAREILTDSGTVLYPFHGFLMRWVYAMAIKKEDPALTFCLLIEKLIDGDR